MALPSGVTTARVTFGQAVTSSGSPADLVFTVTPTHAVIHAASGVTIAPLSDTFSSRSGVQGTVDLPHTDQAGFVDATGAPFKNWAYELHGYWKRGSSVAPFHRVFQIPSGQTTLDLDLIPEGTVRPAVSAPSRGVTSVNGKTGAVVIEAGSGGDPAAIAELRTEVATAASTARTAESLAGTAATTADQANGRATSALSSAASAVATAGAVQTRVDALKPGQPGGVVTTDAAGRIPASAIPPIPGAGLVLVPLAGHPRYLTIVQ